MKITMLGKDIFGNDFGKGQSVTGKRSHGGRSGSILSRAANRLGNYLIRFSST
jgi:hypothetical protein